jgi:hypothetical protein
VVVTSQVSSDAQPATPQATSWVCGSHRASAASPTAVLQGRPNVIVSISHGYNRLPGSAQCVSVERGAAAGGVMVAVLANQLQSIGVCV